MKNERICALVKNVIGSKIISYSLCNTIYDNEEDFLYYGRETYETVNKFDAEEFEELLKNNDYDYLKTVNDLHYEKVDKLLKGF